MGHNLEYFHANNYFDVSRGCGTYIQGSSGLQRPHPGPYRHSPYVLGRGSSRDLHLPTYAGRRWLLSLLCYRQHLQPQAPLRTQCSGTGRSEIQFRGGGSGIHNSNRRLQHSNNANHRFGCNPYHSSDSYTSGPRTPTRFRPADTGAFWRFGRDLHLKKLEGLRGSDCFDACFIYLCTRPECRDCRYYGAGKCGVHYCRQPLPL